MQITKNILSYIMLLFNVQLHPRTRSGSVGKLIEKRLCIYKIQIFSKECFSEMTLRPFFWIYYKATCLFMQMQLTFASELRRIWVFSRRLTDWREKYLSILSIWRIWVFSRHLTDWREAIGERQPRKQLVWKREMGKSPLKTNIINL